MTEKLESNTPSDAATCSPSSDTPETDALFVGWISTTGILDQARKHAEKLERERTDIREMYYGLLVDHQICADKLNAAHASLREMINLNETTGDPDPEITERARALLPENH